jgi:hypothetical protein
MRAVLPLNYRIGAVGPRGCVKGVELNSCSGQWIDPRVSLDAGYFGVGPGVGLIKVG